MNNDLISRSALVKQMCKRCAEDPYIEVCNLEDSSCITVDMVLNAPAVDAEKVLEYVGLTKEAFEMAKADLVPVVRCRDCQYATWAIWAQRYNCEKVRGLLTADNHFCAWGKRREDHGKD